MGRVGAWASDGQFATDHSPSVVVVVCILWEELVHEPMMIILQLPIVHVLLSLSVSYGKGWCMTSAPTHSPRVAVVLCLLWEGLVQGPVMAILQLTIVPVLHSVHSYAS
ncbi:hypothetical protein AVEN_39347-1 [Araneus ventricosus]|uniref:Uncharacterized protein n=1 Tax=Araneus ventricosus TaxID=182803 RepID=A0A4Y2S9T6_ARAVE|nr:hypothetical protein AVEN_39347-1 [Araneus ventricosus]